MNSENPNPPERFLKLLRTLLKKKYTEEIEGDLQELFTENCQRFGPKKAKRLFLVDMLTLLRPTLLRNLRLAQNPNTYPMLGNYFKISSRLLLRAPVNSFINIFGLAVAIGICILGYAFAQWTYNTDQFHEHKNSVHLVTYFANREGLPQQYGQTPLPLGSMLRNDFAHIYSVCRVDDRTAVVKSGDMTFHERVRFADPEFLEMFTFPLKSGSPESLADLNSVVLSAQMAEKYFGEADPIGQDLLVRFNETRSKLFKVTGVAEKFPVAHTIEFDFLINFENGQFADPGYDPHDWTTMVNATFIRLDDPAALEGIRQGMEKYRIEHNTAVDADWAIASFSFEPLETLHERAHEIRNDISVSSRSKYDSIVFLGIIGAFMLALACFNYINIAIVSAAKRLKEIGIRKTIGARRSTVIVQFMTENIVVTVFALVVGILLGIFVFIPWLENLNHFDMGFTMLGWRLLAFLFTILAVTGIFSGIYPSFYISKFGVTGILKGSVKFGRKNPLTKVFLACQLVLACILISIGIMFTQNTSFMAKRSWGYDQERSLYVRVPDHAAFEKLRTLTQQNADVIATAGSQHHLGKSQETKVIHFPGREMEVSSMAVDPDYFSTMGLQLLEGRAWRQDSETDKRSVIVNQTFAQRINTDDPIGLTFEIDSVRFEVIGIVGDFHSYNFFNEITPSMFTLAEEADYRFLAVRTSESSTLKMARFLSEQWTRLYPEIPFDGGLQEDVWGNYFEQIGIHARVWKGFALVAVILTSLGLYGLISLNISGRAKEFSIRKVLGAGLRDIAGNVGSQYVLLFGAVVIMGAPISYFVNKSLFDFIYTYHMPISFTGVLFAVLILVMVFLVTIVWQLRKAGAESPVSGLKAE